MHSLPLRFSTVLLLAVGLLLAACQVPLPYLPVLPAGEDAAVQDSASGNDAGSDDMASNSDAAEETSETMPEEADEAGSPNATIVVSSLRIRSGPGVDHQVVGAAQSGDVFPILGQAFGCQWLNVEHPTLGSVWLSGSAQYASMNVACDQMPAAEAAPAPTPPPVEEAAAEAEPAPTAAAEPVAEPTATPQPEPQSSDPLPADQGCYLIQNYVGPELNVTVTAKDREWSDNFRVPEGGELPYCFSPGRYAVTVDAPPPWADLNTDLDVQAGVHYIWPIEGRK